MRNGALAFLWVLVMMTGSLPAFQPAPKEDAQNRAMAALNNYNAALDSHAAAVSSHNKLVTTITNRDTRFNLVKAKMPELEKDVVDAALRVMDKVQAAEFLIIKISGSGSIVVNKIKKAKTLMDAGKAHYDNGKYIPAALKFIESSLESLPAGKQADKSVLSLDKATKTYGDLTDTILKQYEE